MFALIARQLRTGAVRITLTIRAIAAVIAEFLTLEGFLAGLNMQLRDGVLNLGGDLVVAQAGSSNFIAADFIRDECGMTIDHATAVKYGLSRCESMAISDIEFTNCGISTNDSAFPY